MGAGTSRDLNVDAQALAKRLRRQFKGEVRFDDGSRALYSTDASNYRQVPIGVVIPRDAEDVEETISLCREFEAPILSRGAGTSLAGQCCNVAVLLDFSKYMNRIIDVDPARKLARVQPGVVCDSLRQVAEQYHLTFGPDPATHQWCTFGGMLGNNSCGVHSQMAGRASDNVHALEVLTYEGARFSVGATSDDELQRIIGGGGARGEIYARLLQLRARYARLIRRQFPDIPRRVSGYNLDDLLPEHGFHVARALVGSESTCVTILEATVNLVHSPPHRVLLVLGYEDVIAAAADVPAVADCGAIGLEGLDGKFIHDLFKKNLLEENLNMFPEGGGYLLAEFGGDSEREAEEMGRRAMRRLGGGNGARRMKLFVAPEVQERIWKVRESGLGATAHIPGEEENWEGWEDSAVAPERVSDYLRDLKKLFEKFGYVGSLYGHFGQGCVHTRINFDLKSADGVKRFRAFIDEATSLVVSHGGSLSGEHGDGQSRAEFLHKMYGPEILEAFREFKAIWDPRWKMNPGKLVRPYRIDENLRFGPTYQPDEPETHFHYHGDNSSFVTASERCVGVGKCRRENAGTMCPSYMVTLEEKHSTRGRARLLFEMLRGDTIKDGWRSKAVKEALDLCLACKGCKGECPVHVDMATYKAEFLSHYYQRRLRPVHAFAFGFIHHWARLASLMPGVANWFSTTRWTSAVMKRVAGIAPERQLPAFAMRTFKEWFQEREGKDDEQSERPPVVLWPDTFNNHFHPEVAIAAVEVLEDAGFRVIVPEQNMCCGRPLYDYGMLKTAKRWLCDVLEKMREHIQAGTPVVVLEPSCATVFRDELCNLLPHDQDAKRLRAQTFLLSEFLQKHAPKHYRVPILNNRAVVHLHCHHRAIMGEHSEAALLRRMGLDFEILDSGCCGMAGAFGFEKGEHYDVSVKCGERVLLPSARAVGEQELIITNGFSCREQLHQCVGKRALHLAEVMRMALRTGLREQVPATREPPLSKEKRPIEKTSSWNRLTTIGASFAAVVGAASAAWWKARNEE